MNHNPNPSGICMCGCGQRTEIATRTYSERNIYKGFPKPFIKHHHSRKYATADYIVNPKTGCWEWQRGSNGRGYGRMRVNGKHILAHRHFYETYIGPIPEGFDLDHAKCQNPSCVNPWHMEPVPHVVNVRRGRHVRLTPESAAEILRSSERTSVIARRFGVSQAHVSNIRAGRKWKD